MNAPVLTRPRGLSPLELNILLTATGLLAGIGIGFMLLSRLPQHPTPAAAADTPCPAIDEAHAVIDGVEWKASFAGAEVLLQKKAGGAWHPVATGPRGGCENIRALAAVDSTPSVVMEKMGGSILMELRLKKDRLVAVGGPISAVDPTLPDPPDPMDG